MTREEFKDEAAKHESNWMIGEPLKIGEDENGYPLEVAFHAPDCWYCHEKKLVEYHCAIDRSK